MVPVIDRKIPKEMLAALIDKKGIVRSVKKLLDHAHTEGLINRYYPESEQFITANMEKLEQLLNQPITTNELSSESDEHYTRFHLFPDGSRIFFMWGIPTLRKLCQQYQLQTSFFETAPFLEYIDVENLEPDNFPKALHNKRPIYIIDYGPLSLNMVVDGNHRVYVRHRFGNKTLHNTMKGIFFPAEINMEALYTSFDRGIYSVLTNIDRANRYAMAVQAGTEQEMPELLSLH